MKLQSLLALSLALTGCLAEGDEPNLSEDSNELFTQAGIQLFTPGQSIRVCWVTVTLPGETMDASTLQAAKDQFREDLKNSWERWANIQFSGFNECPTSGSDKYVRIGIRWQQGTNDSGGACAVGAGAYQLPGPVSTTSDNGNLSCGVGPVRTYNDTTLSQAARDVIRTRWRYIAVHEMGHVLGFAHEQDRNSTCGGVTLAGTGWTSFDQNSVMNYCGPNNGALTPDDIRGVIAAYGRRMFSPSMFFNGFEGTDASAWTFAGNGGVDRNIGYARTGVNNGWVAHSTGWHSAQISVRTGGARHRCDVEVQTKMNGAPAQHRFAILGSTAATPWFDWAVAQHNVYRPVQFSFDATADTHTLEAGFWGNGSGTHYMQLEDVAVNCYANLTSITREVRSSTGATFRIIGDHLAAGAATIRYDNVPTSGGGSMTRWSVNLYPDANGNMNTVDPTLNNAGVTCTTAQLGSKIYATMYDGTSTPTQTFAFPARLLCTNG